MLREEILDIHTSLRCVDHLGLFVLVNARFFETLKCMDKLETFLKILPAIKVYLSGLLCLEIDTMEYAVTTIVFLGLSIDTARMQLHDFIDYHVGLLVIRHVQFFATRLPCKNKYMTAFKVLFEAVFVKLI